VPPDAGAIAGTVARGANNVNQQNANPQSSHWDVWTNTGSGLSNEASQSYGGAAGLPATRVAGSFVGLARMATSGVHSSSLGDVGRGMKGQASDVAEQALQLVGLSDHPGPQGVLGKIGNLFALLTSVEQLITAPLGLIPFPAFPALRITDMDFGLPHLHNHPPNVTPPAPPVPLPSTGPVIPIPILSGASRTLINGLPAARCCDIGLGIWCGGYFPLYEVFLGSATVWIEGMRAGRLLVDITKHCIFTSPKPSDPPTGPMFGMTLTGSSNVLIGGVPVPSLTAMAIGAAIKGIFKGLGAIFRKLTAKSYVGRLLAEGVIVIEDGGNKAFRDAVTKDLETMAASQAGRSVLSNLEKDLAKIGQDVRISPLPPGMGDHCQPNNWGAVSPSAHPQGTGVGSGSRVQYDPGNWPNAAHPGTPSDAVLNHELNHAASSAAGTNMDQLKSGDPRFDHEWTNWEEHNTTNADNGYRREQGYPPRKDYNHLP
jgi:uncharacterized Zn-binding protein involved in type VI secretion